MTRTTVCATHPSGALLVGPCLGGVREADGTWTAAVVPLPCGLDNQPPTQPTVFAPGWRIVELTDPALLTSGQADPDEARHLSVEHLPTFGGREWEVRVADADATRQRPLWLTPAAAEALAVRLVQAAAQARTATASGYPADAPPAAL